MEVEVFILVTCKSYEFVFDDACQEKSTLLFVSDVLEPVSQTFPLAGAVNETDPGGCGGGGSTPPSPPPSSLPPHETSIKTKIRFYKIRNNS